MLNSERAGRIGLCSPLARWSEVQGLDSDFHRAFTPVPVGRMMITKLKKALTAALESLKGENPWPVPVVANPEQEPLFFFILTPPYSGSTALSQILKTASGAMTLVPRGEGQWLVPGLCEEDRWNPAKQVDWNSVRAVWLQRVQFVRSLVGKVTIVVEKSPPNLVRIDQLAKVFPNNAMMAFTRNPYASCSSLLHRRHEPGEKTESQRIAILEKLAADWITQCTWIRKWVSEFNLTLLSYEEFCRNPAEQVARITQLVPAFEGINVDETIKVKDYKLQGIADQNPRQVANLSANEREALSVAFKPHEELLSAFGYTSDWRKPVAQGGAAV